MSKRQGDPQAPTAENHDDGKLGQIIDRVAHLLPAQGPVSIFSHHNTLHVFESLPFEQAVVVAGERFGCEPFLSEEELRAEIFNGRITEQDLTWALRSPDFDTKIWVLFLSR